MSIDTANTTTERDALVALSQVTSLVQFYAVWALIGASTSS